jgi:hypothetical protein
MNEELKQLIAARGPSYAATETTKADVAASEAARATRNADSVRDREFAAADAIFTWLASPPGRELLSAMRAAGLGRATISVVDDGTTVLLADGRIELWRHFRMGGLRETFASADEYAAWAFKLSGGSGAALDAPLYALAADVREGRVLDKIAEHLRATQPTP